MFILRVQRWMSGTGHPCILMDKGLITPEAFEADRNDRGFRARLFYRAITGSDLRLVGFTKDTVYVRDNTVLLSTTKHYIRSELFTEDLPTPASRWKTAQKFPFVSIH